MNTNEGTTNFRSQNFKRSFPSFPKHRSLCFEDFELETKLGEGAFSTVIQARLRASELPQSLALKVIPKATILLKKSHKQLNQEMAILEDLEHSFLVRFRGSFQSKLFVCLLFDLVEGSDLFELLSAENRLSEDWLRFYLAETLSALCYLHSKQIVYRDLKPEHVLIDTSGHVKLVDFGLARKIETSKATTVCGTPEYIAPEILLKSSKGYSISADYWSLGILAFELFSGFNN